MLGRIASRIALATAGAALALAAVLASGGAARADDWPTVHHDVARSGYTKDSPSPPFNPMPQYQWVRHFCHEQICSYVEAIIAGDLVYVGTYAGNMYALDRNTGETKWVFKAGDIIRHSPAVHEGRLYFGSQDGKIYCLDAKTGKERWTYQTGAGVWTSPAVAGGLVLMGSRDFNFYALSVQSGELKWKLRTGAPILTTAAVAGDKVLFASEDGHAYCAELTTGKPLWKSSMDYPLSARGYFPVIWNGHAVFVIANWGNGPFYHRDMRAQAVGFVATLAGKGNKAKDWTPIEPTPERLRAEQEAIVKRLESLKHSKTVWCFDLETGKEPRTLPILYETGEHATHSPPSVGADGGLYLASVSYYNQWCLFDGRGKNQKTIYPLGFGRIDLETWQMAPVNPEKLIGRSQSWHGPAMEWEEHYNLSLGGNKLYQSHSDEVYGVTVDTGDLFYIGGTRDAFAGIWGEKSRPWRAKPMPGGSPPIAKSLGLIIAGMSVFHGPGSGSLAVSGKQLFWITGSMLIAVEGR